mgnify:FL=1
MRCVDVGRRLSAWLDGDLPPVMAGAVGSHLEGCAGRTARAAG